MKKIKWIKWAVLAIILGALAVTNPSTQTYSVWAVKIIQSHSNALVSGLSTIFAGTVESAIAHNTTHENFILFGIFKTTLLGHSYTVLGIFNHFIPLSQT